MANNVFTVGVVTTFLPSDADLVSYYLYNKIIYGDQSDTFPVINIYGKDGLPPWEIWTTYQYCKCPHQDFLYFFSSAPKKKTRLARQTGIAATWHETEIVKPIYVDECSSVPYGSLRKFKYQRIKKKKTNKEIMDDCVVGDDDDCVWLLEEFTINQAPDLALYRLKRKMKKKNTKRKFEVTRQVVVHQFSCNSEQQQGITATTTCDHEYNNIMPSLSSCFDQQLDQMAQFLMNDDYKDDDAENMLFSPTSIWCNEAQFRACIVADQPTKQEEHSKYLVAAPQQKYTEPEEISSSSQLESQENLPQSEQATTTSPSNEQKLATDDYDYISMIDFDTFDSTSCSTDEDHPSTLPPCDLDGH